MRMRRTFALIATAGALALGFGSAPPASATANPGTVTFSYNQTDHVYELSPTSISAELSDTFVLVNSLSSSSVNVVNGTGSVTDPSSAQSCVQINDCLLAAQYSITYRIDSLGTIFMKDNSNTTLATLTITSDAMSADSLNLAQVYPTGYLDANGGTCSGTMQKIASPGSIATLTTLTANDCSRENYELAGWAYSQDSTGYDFGPGATVPIGGSSFTLYAIWTPLGVAVTYDANVALSTPCLKDGVDQTTAASRQSGPDVLPLSGSVATAAPCSPDGYTLLGWALTGEGPAVLAPGQALGTAPRMASSKLRVVAPVDTVSDVTCCPTRSRSSAKPRAIAMPDESSACTRSSTRGNPRVIDDSAVDQASNASCDQAGPFVLGESATLYAVWGRTITSPCIVPKGSPLWTFECTDFGSVPVGATATLGVKITNQSQKSRSLQLKPWPSGMAVNGELRVASNTCAALPAKGTCTLTLTWSPAREGALGTVPLIMCQDGNVTQCYQPSAAQQLRGTATAATTLVSYDVEITAPNTPILTGTSATVSARAFRNDAAAANAEVKLELTSGLTFPDGTTTTTLRTDGTGVASTTVRATTAGNATVNAAFGNASTSAPITVRDVLVAFDKDSINAGEQATATITAAPNTRIKYTTFGKLAPLFPGKSCGETFSARFWGMISGLIRTAEPISTNSEGLATITTCGMLADNPRGQSLSSTANANATGPGSLSAVLVDEQHICGSTGCPWGDVDSAAAGSASLQVRTTIRVSVKNGSIPVVGSPPILTAGNSYASNQGVTVTVSSPASNANRIFAQVSSDERPTLWIANKTEVATSTVPGLFPYSTDGFSPPDPKRTYLTSGQQLRMYYVTGSGVNPTITMDVIVKDITSITGQSYVVFRDAITMTPAQYPVTGSTVRLDVTCNAAMGITCTESN